MTTPSQHVIIFSHGFGVRKTERGLFTAIADALPDAHCVMFDYYPVNDEANTLTVKPLNEQALKLRKVINTARIEYPGAILDLVCHSQGCIVAGLVKPRGIRKVIMLTPPDDISEATLAKRLSDRNGVKIDVTVRTRLEGTDGSKTIIHPDYWQSLAGIQPVKLYNRLARFTQLRIINATQDEILGDVTMEGIDPSVSLVTLHGNHNFDSEDDRKRILYILQKELATN
jgi:hypothetical protein